MPTIEQTINVALAEVLKKTRRAWLNPQVLLPEITGQLKGSASRSDILVVEPNVSTVAIETEVFPAATVEAEAVSRLGEQIRLTGRPILSSVAVRLPVRLKELQSATLAEALASATDLEMALYTGRGPSGFSRWPNSGWVVGGVSDLSLLVQSASVPPDVIESAADELVEGVSEASGLLEESASAHPGSIHRISKELRQEDGVQTRRMAVTILANAFVFQETLAGGPGLLATVNSLEQLRGAGGSLSRYDILAEWRKILKVNYWPIFDIARRILETVPAEGSTYIIERLALTAERLIKNRVMHSHDLTGAVFQKLIADRKFLAAYYTTPAAAALLVGLAFNSDRAPGGRAWASADDLKGLRIADFACGTGTLLSTAYQRIGQLHELAGGDAEALHPQMMATGLVGCDVLPAAAHLTASMLAGAHPTTRYEQSSILTVAYGKQPNDGIALGSLDLLDPQGKFAILAITAKAAEGMGETEKQTWESLPHASFDLVLMNPPFTRATGHHKINKIGVPNPMFAAFRSTKEEQRLMSEATRRLTRNTSAHGNAGEASIFLALAHRKLKPDGVLGLVMPLSLMSGDAWEDSRVLLRKNYRDLVLISISGAKDADLSFSADTNMGECLVIGHKDTQGSTRAAFVILKQRPGATLVGSSTARQIHRLMELNNLRQLEDGPTGGTPLYFGDDEIGQVIEVPLPESGGWHLSRIADLALAQTAYQLADNQRAWLPTMSEAQAVAIPMTTAGTIGEIGPLHRDINGKGSKGTLRGPFTIRPAQFGSAPTYPALWSHQAARERTMMFTGESEGQPLKGPTPAMQTVIDKKVASVLASASHCHFNLDFRFNSQSTAMQFTPGLTIGGRAWISLKFSTVEQEKAMVLWANTSLGLLMQWWHANKQQAGRGCIGKTTLRTLPVLDVKRLTKTQLHRAAKVFDETCGLPLLRVHQMDTDDNRRIIDDRFCKEVLNLPATAYGAGSPLELLRMKMALEPSIRGQKKTKKPGG